MDEFDGHRCADYEDEGWAHKVEHAVDLDTGAVVAVTLQEADKLAKRWLPCSESQRYGFAKLIAQQFLLEIQPRLSPKKIQVICAHAGYPML